MANPERPKMLISNRQHYICLLCLEGEMPGVQILLHGSTYFKTCCKCGRESLGVKTLWRSASHLKCGGVRFHHFSEYQFGTPAVDPGKTGGDRIDEALLGMKPKKKRRIITS